MGFVYGRSTLLYAKQVLICDGDSSWVVDRGKVRLLARPKNRWLHRIGPVRKTFPESRLQIFRPPLGRQCRWLLYNVSSFTCSREFLNFTSTNFQARVNLFHSYPFSILMMKLFSHLRSSNVSGPWKNISIPTRFVAFDILICSENISNHKIEKKQQRGNVMKHWTSVIY